MALTIVRQIPLKEQTVRRLKRLADPLDDTYDSLISRLIDSYENSEPGDVGDGEAIELAPANSLPSESNETVRESLSRAQWAELVEQTFDPFAPPSLTHTKITSAFFAGSQLTPASWNGLLDEAVRVAKTKLGSYSELRTICHMNTVEGCKTNEGYHYLPEVGVSVQGQDANDAWRCAAQIARQIGATVDVRFSWRLKEGATYPGANGRLHIGARM